MKKLLSALQLPRFESHQTKKLFLRSFMAYPIHPPAEMILTGDY